MRVSIIFLTISLTLADLALGGPAEGQGIDSARVTVGLNNEPMREAFTRIEQQTKLLFAYQPGQVREYGRISLPKATRTLRATLELLFAGTNLGYRVAGNNIIVYRQERPSSQAADPGVPGGMVQAPVVRDTVYKIMGQVVDVAQRPIPGVSVMIKGTRKGAVTDQRGVFLILSKTETPVLLVNCIGYQSVEYETKGNAIQRGYTIFLQASSTTLSDAVVTGVVRRPNESFTGAVSTFTAEQLRTVGNQNIISSLKTLDASFQVFDNIQLGSNPNALPNIQVRGSSNLPDLKGNYTGYPNLPLFILDGFEVELQRIFDLDMNRVEKVTILKDASGTALYGSRGANGVVVVTTKQPEPGKLRLSYTGDFTLTTPDLSDYHLLNAGQKLQAEKAAGLYTSINGPITQQWMDEQYNRRNKEIEKGVNTDWLAQPLRNAAGQRHYIYLDGGDASFRYALDFSANNQGGVMKGSSRNTYAGGMMLSYRYKQILFRNYLNYTSNRGNNSPYGSFGDFARMNPYWRIKDASGNYLKTVDFVSNPGSTDTVLVANPMYNGTINTKNYDTYQQVTDNFSLEWNLTQGLKLRSNASLIRQKNDSYLFLPADHTYFLNYGDQDFFRKGLFTQGNGAYNSYEVNSYLDFNEYFGKHLIYATGGFDLGQISANQNLVTAEGFPNQFLDDLLFGGQYQLNGRPGGSESLSRRISFQSNFNYSYDSRYVADLSLSTDGSSKFGTANKFAPFWSAGAGWNIHREKWAQRLGVINYLKLRASYGSTGSQNFPAYQAMTTYQYYTDVRYLSGVGAYLMGLGNRDLKWQQKKTVNLGADVNLFDSRLSLTANYYKERTQNQLIDLTIAPSQGFSSYKENVGEVENNGYELSARYMIIKNERRNISWSINGSIYHNDNKLTHISNALKAYNDQQNTKQLADGSTSPVQLYKEGQSMSAIFVVPSLGIDPASGKEIFLKRDGTTSFIWDAADKRAIGDANPKVRGLFGTNFMYHGLTFNMQFSYQGGGQSYNQTLVDRVENADLRYNVDRRVLEERWQKAGDKTFFKNIADRSITYPSSRFVQDDNRVVCESASLQYDFMFYKWKKETAFKTLRATLYVNQPFRWTSIQQERGLDYPFAHTYSLSLQTSF